MSRVTQPDRRVGHREKNLKITAEIGSVGAEKGDFEGAGLTVRMGLGAA
jgi:hypothetical protein